MKYDCLKVHKVGRVGWIEFNRPPRNGFTWDMNLEIEGALDRFCADGSVGVIVFASALASHFSVGAELSLFDGISREQIFAVTTQAHRLTRKLRAAPKPLLGAIHGIAVGGGLEITYHCDLRYAAEDARLGQPEINFNFIPPIGSTQSLVRLLGRPQGLRFLYGGELVSATEALKMGLVDKVLPGNQLREAVQATAAMLASKPPEALAAIRHTVTQGMELSFDEALALEFEAILALTGTENFTEGVRAFLDKRKPVWQFE